jgi:hypothetical protein
VKELACGLIHTLVEGSSAFEAAVVRRGVGPHLLRNVVQACPICFILLKLKAKVADQFY